MRKLGWKTWTRNAHRAGRKAGRNAAEYWEQYAIGGRVSDPRQARETAARVAKGIDEGDPLILDNLPYCDLSGQWADGLTTADVYDAAEVPADVRECAEFQDGADELLDTYTSAYDGALLDTIWRMCSRLAYARTY